MPRKEVRRRVDRIPQEKTVLEPAATGNKDLKTALSGLNAYRKSLLDSRSLIDQRIAAVESAIKTINQTPMATNTGLQPTANRNHRAGSLKDYIERVLSGNGVMTVKQITQAVLLAGYPTRNKTLDKSVGIALAQMRTVAKVTRGKFQLK